MSFGRDDSRRYGHVPPAQYPVGSQQPSDVNSYVPRRPSFNNGDDSSFPEHSAQQPTGYQGSSGRREDELFLGSPDLAQQNRPGLNTNQGVAMSGYHHQYQPPPTPTHAAYNPQNFPRSQSQSLPYHPHPAANRYSGASPTSPTYATQPTNFTPPAYNPAAYAATNSALPQRTATVAGYNSYGYNYSSPAVPQVSAGGGYGQISNPVYNPAQPQAQVSPQPAQQGYSPSLASPQFPPTSTPSSQYDQSYSQSYNQGSYFGSSFPSDTASSAPSSAHPSSNTQTPYPTHSQIPVGPNYDPNSFANRTSRSNSNTSPTPSPSGQVQASPGLRRHPTNAPLPNRPPEDTLDEIEWVGRQDEAALEHVTQDSLINDIVSDLGGSAQRPRPINGNVSDDDLERLRRYNSTASTINHSGDGVNRFASNASTVNRNDVASTYDWDEGDESDPEGAAGLQLMQEDMDDRRFSTMPFPSYMERPAQQHAAAPRLPPPAEEQGQSTDSDFGGMDLGLYGGGYAGNLQYGNEVGSPPPTATSFEGVRPLPTPGSQDYPQYSHASVDYSGTGGLQDPQRTQRLSFDEGDEDVSLHSRQSGSSSPYKEDYPDMFYHPGLSNRPLPALPPGSDSSSMLSVQQANRAPYQHGYSLSADSRVGQDGSQQHVERSISLSSHSNTPHVPAPIRSRTDAAEERRKALKHMTQQQAAAAQQGASPDGYDTGTPASLAAYDVITLPSGRRKKLVPSKLIAADFDRCTEPWALSGITAWVREMAEGEPDLKRKTIEEGLVRLFCAKVPTMNVADAESLSETVVDSMLAAGILLPEEEWVKFGPGNMSGVLWQLTGTGCYAPRVHEVGEQEDKLVPRLNDKNGIPVRCYSHHCGRSLKKANLDNMMSEDDDKVVDWATFYGLTLKDTETKPKKEVERQNNLHEIVTGEEDFMGQLDVLRFLYRDQLRAWQPPIIAANRLEKFLEAVFGKVEAVQQINREYLLAQLKYRQKEQGPWIVGFSDIFREWIRKARPVYIEYSSGFGYANFLIRKEASRNILFRQFLDMVREHKRSKRLDWATFVKAPITRLQRYSLLLEVAKKNMQGESEEKANLEKAIEEIKAVTRECDDKVHEEEAKVELLELQSRLVLRPGFQSALNLDHLGRKLICQGELTRQGSKGVRWVDSHVILFDHYLILAKVIHGREGKTEKKFDVSKEPIPMPLLFLESKDDDPVTKQKGLATPLARTAAVTGSGTQLNKVLSSSSDRPSLEHAATSSSLGSLNTAVTRLAPKDENILYPFRVKHLGHEVYTLYALSQQDRVKWTTAIVEAKTAHARALHVQNAEPFRLRVLSDGAFSYDSITAAGRQAGVVIRGTPLDRSIREMEKVYGPGRGPPPVCRAQVNCATAFNAYGKSIIAIGTDFGVFISEASNPRGWTRSLQMSRVTQITVLEEFSVCLVIADKALISIPLETIAPVSNFPAPMHDNAKRAPVKLAKDVAFFATASMKERTLLFYKRKEGMHNTFKVLEPVFHKSTEKRTKLFGGRRGGSGSTESFRDYDEFYLPTECYSLNLFQTYIAVASAKGFELLTLDKKIPQSIPHDLSLPAIANIASRIRDQRPLGMFKLNDQEFLLAYEDCAVYVDKHGEVSRTLIMEYSGKQKKAKGATMFGQYLLLFNEDYVEVRNAENGRLRQIIAGRDVRCLDYGFRGPTGNAQQPGPQDSKGTVKICMSHPEVMGGQIVLEMLLNDGHAEKP